MKNKNTILVFLSLFLLIILSRWVSHLWNFTLVGGALVFAGSYFKDKKVSVLLMFLSLLVSDYIIGFHPQMLSVYLSFLIMTALGFWLQNNPSRTKIFGFSVAGSVLFYLITNFAVWFNGDLYPRTFEGLVECYTLAIPFFRNQFFADVIFTLGFFEAAKLIKVFVEKEIKA